jgi:hypothetical protein
MALCIIWGLNDNPRDPTGRFVDEKLHGERGLILLSWICSILLDQCCYEPGTSVHIGILGIQFNYAIHRMTRIPPLHQIHLSKIDFEYQLT